MTEAQGDGVSRRNFLKVATLTAVAAAATGGGAALLKRGDSPVTITTAPSVPPANTAAPYATAAPVISDIIPAVSASGDDLMARLAAAQTENMQLRAANDQLMRDLAALQTAEQDGRVARDSMTLELDNARNQLGILGGLVALYQQLDDVDMGEMVENGLGAVGEKVGELLGGTPALAAGLDAGQLALGEIENQIPLLDNGRLWLDAQSAKVQGFYGEVELWLQRALERVGDFFEMLADWFAGLRKWLPFGIGEKAVGVMGALTTLLAEMPSTLAGLDANIAQPLDVWLQRVDGEPAVIRRVVRPVRDEVIGRARTTIEQANTAGTVYEQQLAAPARAAIETRRVLRQAIADYRAQHQIV